MTGACQLDPITLEIISQRRSSPSPTRAYIALMKSAYSTNIKERHDHLDRDHRPRRAG